MKQAAQKLLSTRKGTIIASAVGGLISLLLIVAYVNHVRQQASSGGAPAMVLVAKAQIGKGTPAAAIGHQDLYSVAQVRHDQLQAGALVSPADLKGVAAHDLFPGQQLTASDFTDAPATLDGQLTGDERAISLSFDGNHGLIGQIQAGSHVDVYATFNVENVRGQAAPQMKLLSQDVPVLAVNQPANATAATVILEARNGTEAAKFGFTADNGRLWLILRPASGAKPAQPALIDVSRVLAGTPSIGKGK